MFKIPALNKSENFSAHSYYLCMGITRVLKIIWICIFTVIISFISIRMIIHHKTIFNITFSIPSETLWTVLLLVLSLIFGKSYLGEKD